MHNPTMTLTELADKYDEIMFDGLRPRAKGFTIGKRGKTMFWFIDPTPNGFYRCYPQDSEGNLFPPRYYDPCKTLVTIHLI